MKAICLVVVTGGVAHVATPAHVDCRVIDQDNIAAGDKPEALPRGIGFEELVRDYVLVEGKDYVWESP